MRHARSSHPALLALALIAVPLIGCATDAPGPAELPPIQAGKTGGGKSSVAVNATDPRGGPRDYTLDVRVLGSGFDRGSGVAFAVSGVVSRKVTVNATTFVSSSELIANVTIAADADTVPHDVIVTTSKGTKGIGSELFEVGVVETTWYVANDADYMLRGDSTSTFMETSESPFAGMSRYQRRECGVGAEIFTEHFESGDAVLNTQETQTRPNRRRDVSNCAGRTVRISYQLINGDGSVTPEGAINVVSFLNVRRLQRAANPDEPAEIIRVGETKMLSMAFSDNEFKCGAAGTGAILFREITNTGIVTGADRVQVTRTAINTWVVSTLPDSIDAATGRTLHRDKAWCRATGNLYHMPLRLVIMTPVALP